MKHFALLALAICLCLTGPASASEAPYRAVVPAGSPLRLTGPQVPEWGNSAEFDGQVTIRARFRFVYRPEWGDRELYLLLIPDQTSASLLPYLVWRATGAADKPKEIFIGNVQEAAHALLAANLAEDTLAGKYPEVVGEAVVVIEQFNAGYECESPSFGALFVKRESELLAASPTTAGPSAGC